MLPITDYVSRPDYPQRRDDDHGLRCEFRRLVNGGFVRSDDYADFLLRVDAHGLTEAVRQYGQREL